MAGAQVRHFLDRFLNRFHRHDFLPVFPVLVVDQHADGTADGLAVADAGENLRGVFLDLLPATAPVPLLAAGHVEADLCRRYGQPGRHALNYGKERLPMRFTGSKNLEYA